MVAVTRKSQMRAKLEVNPAAVADVLKVLARHNPGLSKPALAATGKVMAVVSAVAARLSVEQQHRIADDETELAHIVEAAVAELAAKPGHVLAEVSVEKPVEVSRGAGLGQSVDMEEGAAGSTNLRRQPASKTGPVRSLVRAISRRSSARSDRPCTTGTSAELSSVCSRASESMSFPWLSLSMAGRSRACLRSPKSSAIRVWRGNG